MLVSVSSDVLLDQSLLAAKALDPLQILAQFGLQFLLLDCG
jgi:hypothetical protein